MGKTIAVREATWLRLKDLMKEEKANDFDHLVTILLEKAKDVPRSMFGLDSRRRITFTQREHEKITRDVHG